MKAGTYSAARLVNDNGDATVRRLDTNRIIDSRSMEWAVYGSGFNTRVISHQVNVGYAAGSEPMPPPRRMSAKPDHQYLPTTMM